MEQHHVGKGFQYTQALCPRRGRWDDREVDVQCSIVGRFVSKGGFRNVNLESAAIPHIVEAGHGRIEQDGVVAEVEPGDCFMLWPGRTLIYQDRVDSPWTYTWFRLEGPAAVNALRALGMDPARPHYRGDFRRPLLDIGAEIYRDYAANRTTPIAPMQAAWRVLNGLEAVLGPNRKTTPTLAERLHQVFHQQVGAELAIEQLASEFGVNRVTLFRNFRDTYGCAPKKYLIRIRLDRARAQLAGGDEPIQVIARSCGFPNAHYFARVFRADTGMTPSEWRELLRKEPAAGNS